MRLMTLFGLLACLLATSLPALAATDTIDREAAYKNALPLYQYDAKKPLDVKEVDKKTETDCRVLHFTYASTHGQRVPALLFMPLTASAKKPVPCLIMLHGLGGSKDNVVPLARNAAAQGYAALAIDEYGQGERAIARPTTVTAVDVQTAMTVALPQTVVDVRRGIDYLKACPNIDSKRIGLVGVSMGAIIGTVVSGVDTRIKSTVLIAGGGNLTLIAQSLMARNANVAGKTFKGMEGVDWNMISAFIAPEDPLTFAAHIAPRPVLMESGRKDVVIIPEAAQQLYDAASKPKNSHVQIDWYPDAGHDASLMIVLPAVQKWLAKNL